MGFEFLADHRGDQAADQARRPVRAVSIWIVFDDLHSDAERAADRLGPGGAEFVSRIPAGSGASPCRGGGVSCLQHSSRPTQSACSFPRPKTPHSLLWFAAIQFECIKNLPGLAPKNSFIATEAVESVSRQIAEPQEATCELNIRNNLTLY